MLASSSIHFISFSKHVRASQCRQWGRREPAAPVCRAPEFRQKWKKPACVEWRHKEESQVTPSWGVLGGGHERVWRCGENGLRPEQRGRRQLGSAG